MSVLEDQFKRNSFGIIPSVTINLQPEASIVAHPGTLLMADPEIEMNLRILNNQEAQLSPWRKLKRFASKSIGGQSLTAVFTNKGREIKSITLHPENGGNVVWVDTSKYGTIVCQKGAFLASLDPDVKLDLKMIKVTAWQMLTSEQETLMERISVNDGAEPHVFLESASGAVEIPLQSGQKKNLHANSLLAATDSIHISEVAIPGFLNRQFGQEGRRYTVVEGPGTIWLQTSNPPLQGHSGNADSLLSQFSMTP